MTGNNLALWKDTLIKKSILDFVERITDKESKDHIPEEERIAVFDNDGTLWTEQPLQVELFYALDRAKELAEINPALNNSPIFKAFLEMDLKSLVTFSKNDIINLLFQTHDGKSPEEFMGFVKKWFDTAIHPKFNFSYYNSSFKPQIELLNFLRSNGFKTFIVSGGGIDFMRTIGKKMYGIPENQIIGSSGKTKIEYNDNVPEIVRVPKLNSFDDKDEKINNIHLHTGKRPVFAFGNSDGDLAMLRYTLGGKNLNMALLLHHDDDVREVAYDKDFKISPLNLALEVADKEGIKVVSMKNDWMEVFNS